MSIWEDIEAAGIEPKPEPATPETAAILKAADLAMEPMDKRYTKETALEMPAYVYRHDRKKLTRVVMEEICDAIRGGTTEYIAAEAAGITQAKFDTFMRTFPVFKRNVMQAHAQCRAQLEQDVAKKKPLEWLLKGPGRLKPGRDGWTAQTAVVGADGGNVQHEVKHSVDLSRLPEADLLKMKEILGKVENKPAVIVEGEFTNVTQNGSESDESKEG